MNRTAQLNSGSEERCEKRRTCLCPAHDPASVAVPAHAVRHYYRRSPQERQELIKVVRQGALAEVVGVRVNQAEDGASHVLLHRPNQKVDPVSVLPLADQQLPNLLITFGMCAILC
jgi:hypothetical protein